MADQNTLNYIALKPSLLTRLAHKKEYMVIDFTLPDGKYFLDRFFIRQEIHIDYPQGGEYRHPDYPHVVLYRIRFNEKDEEKVKEALKDMYKQAPLMDDYEEYKRSLDFFQKMLKK